MATIGNMAAVQYTMAVVKSSQQYATEYAKSVQKSNYSNNLFNTSSSDEVLKNYIERGDDYVQEQYEKLYNSIFGDKEEEQAETTVSLKGSAMNTTNAAEALNAFAGKLQYGGEYDKDSAKKLLQDFVKDYNSLVENLGNSEQDSVLQKGVILVNTAKAFSGSLGRVGIDVGSDNKLTFKEDYMDQISATDLKSTFSKGGFADKASQKAEQISRLAGSAGAWSYNSDYSQSYAYNIGALLTTYA